MTATGCLSDGEVLAFARAAVAPDDRARMEAHIRGCADCAFLVAQAAGYFAGDNGRAGAAAPVPLAARATAPPLAPGTTLHRYVIESYIGAGGAGTVYRAHDPQLRRRIAIKLLRPESSPGISTEQNQTLLLREAQSMAQLSHPNVVPVFDTGALADQVFMVMELVDGESVSTWLKREQRPWRDIVKMFVAAGRGLAAAHGAGLVHRDFKPDNVLIGRDGRPRVTDFGLARPIGVRAAAADADAAPGTAISAGETTTFAGTPTYMAPEQFQGKPADARTDQFSFSVALYFALCGHHPFAGQVQGDLSMLALARLVTEGQVIPPPPELGLPDWLVVALLRGLCVPPEGRYPAMDDLLTALEGPKPSRRRRVLLASASAGVVAIAATSFVAVTAARCGNGVVERDEQCDDGNTSESDGCLTTCRAARCGDGIVRDHVEECDDGNLRAGDGCTTTCLRCAGATAFDRGDNGHCYQRHDEALPWPAARARCESDGGELLTYDSAAEGKQVRARLLDGLPRGSWIGLVGSAPPGRYTWLTGEPLTEVPVWAWWAPGEPRTEQGNCFFESADHLFADPNGAGLGVASWYAAACDQARPFVCERAGFALRAADNHAYKVIHRPATWDAARDACRELGGHLATIRDGDEQAFVVSLCRGTCWLGAVDRTREGQFDWITGEPFAFKAFAAQEPDDVDGSYDCLALGPDHAWHDRRCNNPHESVCEID